ncbi:hypothetical protein [Methylobacterium sp. WL9]|uniref:hypothetical protein n=1 Tax=Methylobacterium sp. WL9 TaxID=2603898 RepID=UPI001650BED0|nr:hypothetical protein [Methylobacterium sp. WL9]
MDQLAVRAEIEEAAQAALDTVDHLLAILDGMEPRLDDEDGGDAEPDLGAPEGHESQVVWLRGTTRDLELDQHPEPSL